MSKVTIAAGSQITAEAGAKIAEQGGNAVDAAIAATVVSICTDTGMACMELPMHAGAGASPASRQIAPHKIKAVVAGTN